VSLDDLIERTRPNRRHVALPPGMTVAMLKAAEQGAWAICEDDSNWCGRGSEAVEFLLMKEPSYGWTSYAGVKIDTSHVYNVWKDLTILDTTIRQFIDAPGGDPSPAQVKIAKNYPFHPAAPSVAIVPPGHPFYAAMGYNPDPNVNTVADPWWELKAEPAIRGWWPRDPKHPFWRSYRPREALRYGDPAIDRHLGTGVAAKGIRAAVPGGRTWTWRAGAVHTR